MIKLSNKPCYLARGHTDMRKSMSGLAALVQYSFELEPSSEALFVFCNKRRDRIKILEWDGDGFWLYFKRLEKGHFRWPSEGESATLSLSSKELEVLLNGAQVELKLRGESVPIGVAA